MTELILFLVVVYLIFKLIDDFYKKERGALTQSQYERMLYIQNQLKGDKLSDRSWRSLRSELRDLQKKKRGIN